MQSNQFVPFLILSGMTIIIIVYTTSLYYGTVYQNMNELFQSKGASLSLSLATSNTKETSEIYHRKLDILRQQLLMEHIQILNKSNQLNIVHHLLENYEDHLENHSTFARSLQLNWDKSYNSQIQAQMDISKFPLWTVTSSLCQSRRKKKFNDIRHHPNTRNCTDEVTSLSSPSSLEDYFYNTRKLQVYVNQHQRTWTPAEEKTYLTMLRSKPSVLLNIEVFKDALIQKAAR